MFFPLFRRAKDRATISSLYGAIVAQARMPVFYRDYAVPDTLSGRFELIILHLALLIDRLAKDPTLRPLGQAVFDHFCRDMDDNLREMGVGDLAVPKKMRSLGEAYYGRADAYREGLAAADDRALQEALARDVFDGTAAPMVVARLAAYMRDVVAALNRQDAASLAAGRLQLPPPNPVPNPAPGRN
jgi:cytochrome b pre-mRNA-processing protein 3